ncbi:hypothetical protein P4901_22675 [Escherichia coli]
MQTELIKELNKVLKAFPQFWNGEELQRSMVSDAISQKQPDLIKALVANEKNPRCLRYGYRRNFLFLILIIYANFLNTKNTGRTASLNTGTRWD